MSLVEKDCLENNKKAKDYYRRQIIKKINKIENIEYLSCIYRFCRRLAD